MLLLCKTFSGCILAFNRNTQSGALSNCRIWAELGVPVDGCCLDAEGCLWVAVPQVGAYKTSGCVIRIDSTGRILETFGFGQNNLTSCVQACALATTKEGVHWLYVMAADSVDEDPPLKQQNARIKAIQVDAGPATHASCDHYCGGYC
eukprot:15306221-Ditylum_brightwellii.AAC.1